MVREILKIYTDNGLGDNNPTFKDIELTEYNAKFVRMGFNELTGTLMWDKPLDDEWHIGKEYVVLRGERFYIDDTPTSEKSNTDARWKHNIEFTSEYARGLGNIYFEDAVPYYSATYDKPCTNSSKVTFYGTIYEFIDRLNCALLKAGIGDSRLNLKTDLTTQDEVNGDGYCVMLDPYGADTIYDPNKSYEFSFEDKTIWKSITEGYTITEIPFERRGRKIIFGALPKVIDHKFEYGHDNELLSVNKNNAKAQVINRITMYGSTENIPYYYPNETEYGHIKLNVDKENLEGKFKIENYHQLVNKIPADKFATLLKYDEQALAESISETIGFSVAFHNPDEFKEWKTDTLYLHTKKPNEAAKTFWYVKIRFNITALHDYILSELKGSTWMPNEAPQTKYGNLMQSGFNIKSLTKIFQDEENNKDLTEQVTKDELGFHLGLLDIGTYEFVIYWKFDNTSRYFKISGATIGDDYQKTGYYWAVDDKNYDGVGSIGISLDSSVTLEEAKGVKVSWEGVGRMPFQENLVPPKYRNTEGAERFYNALNAPYTEEYASEHPDAYADPDNIDPLTNKPKPYEFVNPFEENRPSEYIHRNEDIKPTIEGVENADGLLLGVIADIEYDDNDNDSLVSDATEDNDKNDSLKYEHSFFYIKLNIFNGEYGFDLFSHASQTDAMTLQMRDGSCNGCKFKIQAAKFTDETGLETYQNPVIVRNGRPVGVLSETSITEYNIDPAQQNTQTHSIWICVQKDAETFGVIMPNQSNNFKPQIGDTFNIINIDLPQSYILAAEKRLEEDGMRFMADNNEEKFTFDIQASRIFFAENPDVLAQLDEYSKIKVKYNGRIYEQYVNQLTIDCKNNEALPSIGIDLTDTLAVGQSFVEQVAERASSLISNPYTTDGALGGGRGSGGLTTRLADLRYLKKTESDRSKGKIASDIGFEIGEFVSGGSGGIFYQDPETGQTYIEADKLKIRMKAIFEELEIAKVSTIGGKFIITPGGGLTISFVEELDNAYRCYFKAKDEDKGAKCRFVVGDQVQCHEFNIQNGTTQNASNRYYWRLVTAVNNEESYIELSKSDCDNAYEIPSDAPQAGDTIVQLGNRNDAERQSAIVLSTIDAFAPCVTLYNGIDHYSLDGKAVVEYGVDKTKNPPEPFFNCYGRFFFGPKGGNSYLKFEPSVGKLIFSGELINISHLNGKDIDQYIKDVVPPVTQEDIEGYVNAIVDPQIENIQNQIDGVIETWFYNGVPTLSNYPASEWNTDALKIAHLGDLYYDNDTGTAYRFSQDNNGNYYWNTITDDAITNALAAAKNAQDTADGKRRTFTAQPVPPYDEGDIWTNATYGTYSNDILRCITKKAKGEAFNISDWTPASKYTDDSALYQFIQGYESTIGDIKTQIDGKAQTWYQATDPSTAWNTTDLKAMHKGDLWYNTTNGTTWYWDGSKWQQQDVPKSVFDAIDGKADIFVTKPTSYHVNDLWFLDADYKGANGLGNPKKDYLQGTLMVATTTSVTFNASHWTKKDRYTDDTKANQAIEEIGGYQYLKQAIANGASLFQGGLILSGLIKLGEWDLTDRNNPVQTEVWAGMNGIYNHPKTIASWWGGDMVDKFYNDSVTPLPTPLTTGYAKALVRMDGSAYFSGGNIGFNADGSGWLGGENKIKFGADGSMTFGNGIRINLSTGDKGLTETIESFANLLRFFVPEDADGKKVAWSADNVDRIRVEKGFYSDRFISARGMNDSGVGSGGGGLIQSVYNSDAFGNIFDKNTLTDTFNAHAINDINTRLVAHIGNEVMHITSAERALWNQTATNLSAILGSDTDTVINKFEEIVAFLDTYTEADTLANLLSNKADKTTSISAGTGLTGGGNLTTSRTLSLATSGVTAGTYFKTTVDVYGRVTAGSNPTTIAGFGITDAYTKTEADTRYVNVTGDTMTGNLTLPRLSILGSNNSTAYITADNTYNAYINIGGNSLMVWTNDTKAVRSAIALAGQVSLGIANVRWANIYSVLGNFSGKVTAQSLQIGDCEITWDAGKGGLKFSKGIYSDEFVSARGVNSAGSSGGGSNFNLMRDWPTAAPTHNTVDALGANLGWELYQNKADKTWVEDKGYLTSHQSLDAYLKIDGSNGTAAGVNALINKLTTSGSTPVDADYFISQYVNGGTTTTTYHRRPMSALWSYIKGKADSVYLPLTGGTLTGGLTINSSGWGQQLIIKRSDNNSNVLVKFTGWNESGQKYDDIGYVGFDYNNEFIVGKGGTEYKFDMIREATIDLSTLDVDTFYPVLFKLISVGRICDLSVMQASKATWGSNGTADNTGKKTFWCCAQWQSSASGWGALVTNRYIYQSTQFWTVNSINVIGEIGQLDNSSTEYIYLRGGAKYLCRATNCTNIYYVETSTTIAEQTIAPKSASERTPINIARLTDNVASATKLRTARSIWGQDFDGTKNVSGNLSNVGHITPLGDNIYNLGIANVRWANIYSVLGNFSGKVTAQSLQIGDCEITWDAGKGGLKFSKGIYSDEFVSARGVNSAGSSGSTSGVGSGYNRLDAWSDYTSAKSGYVLSAALGYDLYQNKLSLSGGILTGNLGIKFDTDTSRAWGFTWKSTNGTNIAQILMHNTAKRIILNAVGATDIFTNNEGKYSLVVGNNELSYNTKPILTSANVESYALTSAGTQSITGLKTFNRDSATGFYVNNTAATNTSNFIAILFQHGSTTVSGLAAYNNVDSSLYRVNGAYSSAYMIWDEGNDGTGSGLDADKLDGKHNGDLDAIHLAATNIQNVNANTYIGANYNGRIYYGTGNSVWTNLHADITNVMAKLLLVLPCSGSSAQLMSATNNRLYFRVSSTSSPETWNKLAYVTDNVASATKLMTARSIWGQDFDGTKNVSGAISNAGNITPATTHSSNLGSSSLVWERIYGRYIDTDSGYNLRICVVGNEKISIVAANGYVGINNTSPAYQLDVTGVIHSTVGMFSDGYVSARGQNTSSDERLKTIIRDFSIDVRKIAKAPVVDFQWKSDSKRDIGSIAQYWKQINPMLTPESPNGFLTLQYGKAALLSVVSVARKVVSHEDEIRKLKDEIKRLNNKIERLEMK